MARALNIKIKDELYNQLHHRAKNSDCTKTEIVETALHRLFNDVATDVGDNVDSVDNTATDVDTATNVDNVDDVATNVDEIIQQKLQTYLEGVSCQLPTNVDSGVDDVDSGVDSNVDDVDSGVDSNVDDVDSGVDDVDSGVDDVDSGVDDVDSGVDSNVDDVDTTPKTLKVKELAERLMMSDKQIYEAAKHEAQIIGTPPNASHPEKWEYIPKSKPKQFKLIVGD